MSDLEKSFRDMSSTDNVFLFVPNLIGYARIFLALLRSVGSKSLTSTASSVSLDMYSQGKV